MISRNEKKVKENLILIIAILGIIISSADAIYSVMKTSTQHTFLGYFLVGISVCTVFIVLLFFEHVEGIDWAFNILNFIHKDPYIGTWLLKIEYTDEQGQIQKRHGYCKFEGSVTGLRIVGQQIFDENNNVVEDKWRADKVDIIENHNKIILIYTYLTQEDNLATPLKIGLATSTCTSAKKKEFFGEFSDYNVENSPKKIAREGTISLLQIPR